MQNIKTRPEQTGLQENSITKRTVLASIVSDALAEKTDFQPGLSNNSFEITLAYAPDQFIGNKEDCKITDPKPWEDLLGEMPADRSSRNLRHFLLEIDRFAPLGKFDTEDPFLPPLWVSDICGITETGMMIMQFNGFLRSRQDGPVVLISINDLISVLGAIIKARRELGCE